MSKSNYNYPIVDFSHRLCLISDREYNTFALHDSVSMMVDTGVSTLHLLSELVEADRLDCINKNSLQSILYTVINQMKDIDALVLAFHDYTLAKEPPAKG